MPGPMSKGGTMVAIVPNPPGGSMPETLPRAPEGVTGRYEATCITCALDRLFVAAHFDCTVLTRMNFHRARLTV